MDSIINHYFVLDPEIMLRIITAMILGGVIGLEREIHGRPAGLRTHILVCVGATVMMLSSEPLLNIFGPTQIQKIQIDPGRIVAGIVTGIGFLGAGAIIKMGDIVRGLTTSACIWFVAGLGIIVGEGAYSLALFSTAIVLFSLLLLNHIEYHILPYIQRNIIIGTTYDILQKVDAKIHEILASKKIAVHERLFQIDCKANTAKIAFHIHVKQTVDNLELSNLILQIPGIQEIKWQ